MKKSKKGVALLLLFCFILTCSTSYGSMVYADDLTNGLVAHYAFNGNANDSSGNGNNGVVSGVGTTYVASVEGQGIKLTGKGWVEVPASSSLNLSTAFTFSAWVYSDHFINEQPILAKGDSAGDTTQKSPYAFIKTADGSYMSARLCDNDYGYREYVDSSVYADIQSWQLLTVS